VKAAASAQAFIAAPAGTFFGQRTFIICAPSTERLVVTHFAAFEPAEAAVVPMLVTLPNSPGMAPRYDLVYDISAVPAMDRPTFSLFEGFTRSVLDVLDARVRRMAVIRPAGLTGVLFTGMFHDWLVPRLGDRVQMFEQHDDAYAFLGFPAVERADLEQTIDAFTNTTPLVRQMRDLLASEPQLTSLDDVAERLGTSARSLQRHLGEAGTTFRDELAEIRIRAARAMLVDTDHKVEVIAAELGFKSVAAFTTMFKTAVGDTPAAYRDARRPK